jgi:uncharacterized lipoprotein YehR (DUF1307 family)
MKRQKRTKEQAEKALKRSIRKFGDIDGSRKKALKELRHN